MDDQPIPKWFLAPLSQRSRADSFVVSDLFQNHKQVSQTANH